jgi:hypothetical protein
VQSNQTVFPSFSETFTGVLFVVSSPMLQSNIARPIVGTRGDKMMRIRRPILHRANW